MSGKIKNLITIFLLFMVTNLYSQISIVSNKVLSYKWSRNISQFQLSEVKSDQYSIVFTDGYSNVILIKDGVTIDQWVNYKGVGVSTINQKKVIIGRNKNNVDITFIGDGVERLVFNIKKINKL